MTKNDFLNTLYQSLLYLPAKERQEILQDYEEHFAAGIEEGKAEEEICRALGDPKEIAQTYLQQNKARPGAYKQDSPSNPAPVRNAGTAAAQPYPIPPDNGNRALFDRIAGFGYCSDCLARHPSRIRFGGGRGGCVGCKHSSRHFCIVRTAGAVFHLIGGCACQCRRAGNPLDCVEPARLLSAASLRKGANIL